MVVMNYYIQSQYLMSLLNKMTEFKIYLFSLLFFSLNTNAEQFCNLSVSDNNLVVDKQNQFVFDKHVLNCGDFYTSEYYQNLFLKKDLIIVRGHINELKSVDILASSHGYHLIQGAIDCSFVHCDHLNQIDLDKFNSIKPYNAKITDKNSNKNSLQLINLIDSSLWLADIVTLSSWNRKSGSVGNNLAKTWIESKFNNLSLQTSTQSFSVSGDLTNNIIGIQTGITTPDNWYIVSAHMDSRPYTGNAPGAVDNASGCAGVLELARISSLYTFDSTIIFICYSGEEQGLIGSYFHANSLINNSDQTKVKAALTMDMVGFKRDSSSHELLLETSASNQWLMDILASNATTYVPNLTIFMSTNPWGSDHVPYIENNMHGILSIDNDWSLYTAYHQSNDLPENINLTQGEYILKTNLATLAELAGVQGVVDLVFYSGFE